MSGDATDGKRGRDSLTPAQRRRVLALGSLACALALAVPAYYVLAAVAPAVAAVPRSVPLGATAVGLCLGFPLTLGYAHALRARSGRRDAREQSYGVGDEWERRNL